MVHAHVVTMSTRRNLGARSRRGTDDGFPMDASGDVTLSLQDKHGGGEV